MRKVPLTVLLAVMLSSPAAATEWTQVAQSDRNGGYTAWVDNSRIVEGADQQTVWVRFLWAKVSPAGLTETRMLRYFDCNEATTKLLAYVDYGKDREVVGSETIPAQRAPDEPFVPETVMAAVASHVCGREF